MGQARWLVIGVDPGPTTGIVGLHWQQAGAPHAVGHTGVTDAPVLTRTDVVQCGAETAVPLVEWMLARGPDPVGVAIETFVVRTRAARSNAAAAGATTRELVTAITAMVEHGEQPRLFRRTAAQVKPWTTDTRLAAAGLTDATKGMPHARDAARHALFAARHDFALPDPLSRKGSV